MTPAPNPHHIPKRRIVGWSTAPHVRREMVLAPFNMAYIKHRRSAVLILHSDRASQYASHDKITWLDERGI
jgi:putative transposase